MFVCFCCVYSVDGVGRLRNKVGVFVRGVAQYIGGVVGSGLDFYKGGASMELGGSEVVGLLSPAFIMYLVDELLAQLRGSGLDLDVADVITYFLADWGDMTDEERIQEARRRSRDDRFDIVRANIVGFPSSAGDVSAWLELSLGLRYVSNNKFRLVLGFSFAKYDTATNVMDVAISKVERGLSMNAFLNYRLGRFVMVNTEWLFLHAGVWSVVGYVTQTLGKIMHSSILPTPMQKGGKTLYTNYLSFKTDKISKSSPPQVTVHNSNEANTPLAITRKPTGINFTDPKPPTKHLITLMLSINTNQYKDLTSVLSGIKHE